MRRRRLTRKHANDVPIRNSMTNQCGRVRRSPRSGCMAARALKSAENQPRGGVYPFSLIFRASAAAWSCWSCQRRAIARCSRGDIRCAARRRVMLPWYEFAVANTDAPQLAHHIPANDAVRAHRTAVAADSSINKTETRVKSFPFTLRPPRSSGRVCRARDSARGRRGDRSHTRGTRCGSGLCGLVREGESTSSGEWHKAG